MLREMNRKENCQTDGMASKTPQRCLRQALRTRSKAMRATRTLMMTRMVMLRWPKARYTKRAASEPSLKLRRSARPRTADRRRSRMYSINTAAKSSKTLHEMDQLDTAAALVANPLINAQDNPSTPRRWTRLWAQRRQEHDDRQARQVDGR